MTHTTGASEALLPYVPHIHLSRASTDSDSAAISEFPFFTYSHPCQIQYSSLKICIFVYCLHKCSVHLVTWSRVRVFSPTRVKDKAGCAVTLQTTYVATSVVTHCRALATPGCYRWHHSRTLCREFWHAQYESNTPHHQWMDPFLPGGNDRLHQSSKKLIILRKTVDLEDSCFS
jgi:hypothetical protein